MLKSTLVISSTSVCIRSELWQENVTKKNLYAVDNSDIFKKTTTASSITHLINRYNLTQFYCIWNGNNKFMDIRIYCSTSRLDWLGRNSVNTWPFIIFHLFKRHLNLKGSSISGPAICTSVSLRTSTPHKFNSWQKWLFYLLKILWEPAQRSPSASFT